MKKHFTKVLTVLVLVSLIFNTNVVYARNRDFSDELVFSAYNIGRYIDLVTGYVFEHFDGYTTEECMQKFYQYGQENAKWKEKLGKYHTYNEFEEWWRSNLKVVDEESNETGSNTGDHIEFTDEFSSYIFDFSNSYAEELDDQAIFSYRDSCKPIYIKASNFEDIDQYNNAMSFVKSLCNKYDYVFIYPAGGVGFPVLSMIGFGLSVSQCGLVGNQLYIRGKHASEWLSNSANQIPIYYYDFPDNRNIEFSNFYDFYENAESTGNFKERSVNFWIQLRHAECAGRCHDYTYYISPEHFNSVRFGDQGLGSSPNIITLCGSKVKVFTSLSDLVDYQANCMTYPYYKHDPVVSNNSITKTQIDNSVHYGDIDKSVRTTIIDKGGITPEELEKIIDAFRNQNPGSGGGGGNDPTNPDPYNPNPTNPDDPGYTPNFNLSALLKGLMALLESIFNLFATLIGYVAELLGQLINSINGIVNNIKTLITDGVMGIFSAVFPFLPPEITSLLTVTFLLCAIIAIIKFIRG